MKKGVIIVLIFLYTLILGGCGSSNKGLDPNRVKVDSLKFSLIGDAKAKYQLDNKKTRISRILDEVGSSPSDLSNQNNPIPLKSGQFYSVEFNFQTTKSYKSGVNFAFVIVDEKSVENVSKDDYYKLLYYTNSGTLSSAGEHSIKANIFISTDIPIGKYALVVTAIDKDTKNGSNQEKNVKKLPMSGSVYIEITEDNESKRAELVDINATKYIDLPYTGIVVNGHTNKKVGSASLIFYNTSDKDEALTVSAQLELEDGRVLDLVLLDSNDRTIKNEIKYTLPTSENYMASFRKIGFSYYILESDYIPLVNSIPDLSIDQNTDGLKAKVIWHIESSNHELVLNDIENEVFLTKFLNNYQYTNMAAILKPNKDLHLTAHIKQLGDTTANIIDAKDTNYNIMDYVDDRPIITADKLDKINKASKIDDIVKVDAAYQYGGGNLISGKNIVGYIDEKLKAPVKETKEFFDYSFDKIDAAFKIDNSIYFFRGDKYVVYDTTTKKTSASDSIWNFSFLSTINEKDKSFFDRIDAATYHDNHLYFFSGKQYIEIYQDVDVFYAYEIKNINDTWGNVEHVTAAFSDPKVGIIFFNNLETKIGITKQHMFKYGGKVDEFEGDKYWGAISFRGSYNIKGNWKVPGVEGDASAKVAAFIANQEQNIVDIHAKVEVNIGKKHPSLGDIVGGVVDNSGGEIYIQVLKDVVVNQSTYPEKPKKITETLEKDDVDSAYVDAPIITNLFEATETWNKHQEVVSIHFAAGPVPISIQAGFDGELGAGIELGVQGIGIEPKIVAPEKLSVWVAAGVDVYIAKASVGGQVDLINLTPSIALQGNLSLEGGLLKFNSNTQADFVLNLIRANLYASFEIDLWITSIVSKFTIYSSPWLYSRKWILLDEKLADLPLPI